LAADVTATTELLRRALKNHDDLLALVGPVLFRLIGGEAT